MRALSWGGPLILAVLTACEVSKPRGPLASLADSALRGRRDLTCGATHVADEMRTGCYTSFGDTVVFIVYDSLSDGHVVGVGHEWDVSRDDAVARFHEQVSKIGLELGPGLGCSVERTTYWTTYGWIWTTPTTSTVLSLEISPNPEDVGPRLRRVLTIEPVRCGWHLRSPLHG